MQNAGEHISIGQLCFIRSAFSGGYYIYEGRGDGDRHLFKPESEGPTVSLLSLEYAEPVSDRHKEERK